MAKVKTCRECKAEIPANARKCMHCGSKQGIGLVGATFVIVVSLFVFGAIVGGQDYGGSSSSSSKPTPVTFDDQANMLCMDAVRAAARFPSSVSFSAFSSPPMQRMAGGGWIVMLAFTAKNGLGNDIPQMARCEVKGGKMQNFSVSDR